jgi:hypothetical protein
LQFIRVKLQQNMRYLALLSLILPSITLINTTINPIMQLN